ncbi:hypothetical protein C0J52_25204 [Blattella germanica]|nr:hypothetical protein C0J52_25204 [Blattella germanica]
MTEHHFACNFIVNFTLSLGNSEEHKTQSREQQEKKGCQVGFSCITLLVAPTSTDLMQHVPHRILLSREKKNKQKENKFMKLNRTRCNIQRTANLDRVGNTFSPTTTAKTTKSFFRRLVLKIDLQVTTFAYVVDLVMNDEPYNKFQTSRSYCKLKIAFRGQSPLNQVRVVELGFHNSPQKHQEMEPLRLLH